MGVGIVGVQWWSYPCTPFFFVLHLDFVCLCAYVSVYLHIFVSDRHLIGITERNDLIIWDT